MYLLILVLPIMGTIMQTRKVKGTPIGLVGLGLLINIMVLYELMIANVTVELSIGTWIEMGNLKIGGDLGFDKLTGAMLIPIYLITFLVLVYSLGYLEGDPHKKRFIALISLFEFAMLILISGNNVAVMFVGWELVGLVSYLLINYWYTSLTANKSALKAMLVNRVGDIFFTLTIILVIVTYQDTKLNIINSVIQYTNRDLGILLGIFLIIAASAKSGQIGLHHWLPAAMAAPTPTSALLHSSTMVTAGVYLLTRMTPVIELTDISLMIILWIGSLTAILGAANGLVQNDIKKIIAYSTTSQLGYMMVAIGMSSGSLAIFHLCNHAMFKSLLFLTAGGIIHTYKNSEQDIRKYGSLVVKGPINYVGMLIGSLSLMAIPFLTGFYSKDYIILELTNSKNITTTIAYIATVLAAVLTASYSIRLIITSSLSRPKNNKGMYTGHTDNKMTFVIIVLTIMAIVFGYLTSEYFLNSIWYSNSIWISPAHLHTGDTLNDNILKFVPMLIMLTLCLALPIIGNSKGGLIKNTFITILNTLNNYNMIINGLINYTFKIGLILHRYIDKGALELFGTVGLSRFIDYMGFRVALLNTGLLTEYTIIVMSTFLFLILFI